MFENATRKKYRYSSARGLLTTEDLWDLPLESTNGVNLDVVAQGVAEALAEKSTKSFVKKVTRGVGELEEKLEIVKYIIDCKLAERREREKAVARKAEKELLETVLVEKEVEELKNLSAKELKKRLGKL